MTRAQTTSTTQQNTGGAVVPFAAGKNKIINGGFDIWQRGTNISIAALSSTIYCADRWNTSTGTNQATTISRQTTSDTTNLPNIQYCARVQRNSGQTGTGLYFLSQSMETSTSIPLAGKTVTFSFYARAGANYSATSNVLGVYIYTGTGTDQNVLVAYTGQANTNTSVTLTTTWQRFTFTTSIPSTATEISTLFGFTPTGTAGAADYYEVTGIQLESGSVATPFQTATGTIQGELAACQRYFQRIGTGAGYIPICVGQCTSTTTVYGIYPLKVTMRATPVVTISTTTGGSVVTASRSFNQSSTWGTNVITSDNIEFLMTIGSGLVAGNASEMWAYTGYADISAEL